MLFITFEDNSIKTKRCAYVMLGRGYRGGFALRLQHVGEDREGGSGLECLDVKEFEEM